MAAGREGDWQCPNADCINHQKMVFGSKATCPKCGAPKDEAASLYDAEATPFSSAGFGARDNDANGNGYHGDVAPPPPPPPRARDLGGGGGENPDDWPCPNTECINNTKLVFAKRPSCPACGTAKNAKKAGDWLCPNDSCVNSRNTVFASKISCPKCGAPRPQTEHARRMHAAPMQPMMMQQNPYLAPQGVHRFPPMDMRGGGCGGCGGGGRFGGAMAPIRMPTMQMQTQMPPMRMPMQPTSNPGDWRCPNHTCGNNRRMVFARHESCPLCGSGKVQPFQPAQRGGKGGSNPADWQCPNEDCINSRNKVFAKHESCPSCHTPKPDNMGGSSIFRDDRSRSPYRTAAGA